MRTASLDRSALIASIREAAPLALPDAALESVADAYAQPVRAYHSLQHVVEVCEHFSSVARDGRWSRPVEVFLAVLYHDAIYVAGRRDNETRSAAFARAQIERWMPAAVIDVDRVEILIKLTAQHGRIDSGAVDADAALFLDCDMAILGAPADGFAAYDRGIASEYRGVMPGWLFEFNRRRFLKTLLARPRIFLSARFHERFDAAARANLGQVLKRSRSALRAGAGR
jgi:predicted metal-dependent HD superfamily phosphohydrolase